MTKSSSGPRVVISNNGPYLVSGDVPLAKQTIVTDREGESQQWRQGDAYPAQESYQLCRCGKSKTKPFCDGTHEKIGFDGTETAPRTTYREQAQVLEGPVLALTDAQSLCAGARFCDPNGQVWNQVERTEDAELRTTFLRQVNNCPSGRLVAWDRASGKPIEHALPVSIGLIEDPSQGVSGPLWLRGAHKPNPCQRTKERLRRFARALKAATKAMHIPGVLQLITQRMRISHPSGSRRELDAGTVTRLRNCSPLALQSPRHFSVPDAVQEIQD